MHEYKIIASIGTSSFQIHYVKIQGFMSFAKAKQYVSFYAEIWCIELIK